MDTSHTLTGPTDDVQDVELTDTELEAAAGGSVIGTIVCGPLAGAVAAAAREEA